MKRLMLTASVLASTVAAQVFQKGNVLSPVATLQMAAPEISAYMPEKKMLFVVGGDKLIEMVSFADEKNPKVVMGAWAWGNDGTFGQGLTASELRPVFDAAMNAGLTLWDTAYVYGMGESERMLAGFLKDLPREDYRVSDKLTPQCMDASSKTAVADMYGMQLRTMGLDHFDVYWVHNTVDSPRWIGELAAFFEGGEDAPMIGVSNHNLAEVKQANAILREHGLRLGAVQNHFSLINRSSEDSGILDWCHQNDVEFWSYMVLE